MFFIGQQEVITYLDKMEVWSPARSLGIREITKAIGCSESSVVKSVKALVKHKIVASVPDNRNGFDPEADRGKMKYFLRPPQL